MEQYRVFVDALRNHEYYQRVSDGAFFLASPQSVPYQEMQEAIQQYGENAVLIRL